MAVVEAKVILGDGRQVFEEAHRVVGDHTNSAADEVREIRRIHILVSPEQLLQDIERVVVAGCERDSVGDAVLLNPSGVPFAAEDQERLRAEKRVAGETFAALDKFQEKAVRQTGGDLTERRDGRSLHIGEDFTPHGDQIAIRPSLGTIPVRIQHRCHRLYLFTVGRIKKDRWVSVLWKHATPRNSC